MLIYLDNCSFNRPFDNQKQKRINIETLAKLKIQSSIILGEHHLAWSYILDYENNANPYSERKETIAIWKYHAIVDTSETKEILSFAKSLTNRNIKSKDALHIACAIELKCEYFITTDMALIKKCFNLKNVTVINPVEFVKIRNL